MRARSRVCVCARAQPKQAEVQKNNFNLIISSIIIVITSYNFENIFVDGGVSNDIRFHASR